MLTKFFRLVFASSGDTADIPDAAPVDGSVSFESGYGPPYQLNPDTDPAALDIERTKYNGLFKTITQAIRYLQVYFAPEWIDSESNGGAPYAYNDGALVYQPSDGLYYQSIVPANTATPGTDGTKWIPFLSDRATVQSLNAEATARADADALLTPLAAFASVLNFKGQFTIPLVVGGCQLSVKFARSAWHPTNGPDPTTEFVAFDSAFPTATLCAIVSTEIDSAATAADAMWQSYSHVAGGVTVVLQQMGGLSSANVRANIVAIGY